MCEIWRPIEGYEGYFVSNTGRVRDENGLRSAKESNNRVQVGMKKEGKWKRFDVSRLVAKAFIPNPYNLDTVNHRDGNYYNNNVDNLKWCSRSECPKLLKRRKTDVDSPRKVKEVPNPRKRAVFQISLNGDIIRRYESLRAASREAKVSVNGMHSCCVGKTKTAGGYKWQYADKF